MKKKKPIRPKNALSSLAILVLFLIAINFAVAQKSLYLDLTQDRVYTASEASRQILGQLKDPVTVTFYISKDLPADYINYKTQVQDLLGQYADLSQGKLQLRYETPGSDDQAVKGLEEKGIAQMQSQVVDKDKIEVKRFFFGAEIASGDKKEVLSSLPELGSLEYELVSAIHSVSKDPQDTPVVAFLGGHGEKEVDASELKKSYGVEKVIISTEEGKRGFSIADESAAATAAPAAEKKSVTPKTLVIAGPTAKLSEAELGVLDEFVSKGGKLVVLSERINPDFSQGFVSKSIDTNIGDFTKKYGIEINNDLVYDKSNMLITYSRQTAFGTIAMTNEYPFWVKAVREGFSDHPALSKVQSLTLLWASSLKIEDANGFTAEGLVRSSSDSVSVGETADINPGKDLKFTNGGRRTLAAMATSASGGEIVVVGDSDFVSPTFMQPIPDNETFFLNLVDSISSSVNLSSIRSKNINDRPLRELTEGERSYWKFFSVAGGTILLCAYGFMRISRRRKLSRANNQ
jgi:ABC-type uncharacterized transport system involved in gliding motility auxiliary subunit